MQSVTPVCTHTGLGSSAFARRYLRNRVFFLFLRVLRCFSSPGSPPYVMDWRMDTWGLLMWVSPFRDLRINGYLLLPEAYRSLSRLSSALSAKASALCPFCLTFAFWYPSVGISGLDSHCLIDKINYRCLPILRLYIKDIWLVNQIYMYAVFKVRYWLNFYQSYKRKNLFLLISLVKPVLYIYQTCVCFFLFDLAATCSPTPSPVQYHRPLRS